MLTPVRPHESPSPMLPSDPSGVVPSVALGAPTLCCLVTWLDLSGSNWISLLVHLSPRSFCESRMYGTAVIAAEPASFACQHGSECLD